MALSDAMCRNAKASGKAKKLSDSGGLHLFVTPAGGRHWRMAYRFDGKQKQLSFGPYPAVSLKDARERRDEAKSQLAAGVDPSEVRKLATGAAVVSERSKFRAVATSYLEKMQAEGRAEATVNKARWLLEDFAYPAIGERAVNSIKPAEVLEFLKQVEARGTFETARRLRGVCSRVFRYAVSTQKAEIDPTHPLKGALIAPKTRHHSAIVEPKAIGALLRAIDDYQGNFLTSVALKLAALTFVRPGELRLMEWSEVDFENAVWSIPPDRMKMRRAHKVPLAIQAISVLREIQPLTGSGRFVFPSLRSTQRGMSENTMNAALRRMGFDKDEMTSHGFRSMAATRLNEMGRWSVDAIERQLAHQDPNAVRRAYTHAAEFWGERVEMMQVWADYLDSLRSAASPSPAGPSQPSV